MAGQLPPPKTFTDWIAAIMPRANRVELFRLRPLLAARRASTAQIRHHHRRRHRVHAGFAARSLGRHAAARVFVFGNDRHPRTPRAARRSCAKPLKKLIRCLIRATAPGFRRTRLIPRCRNCCNARPARRKKENGASASTSPSRRRNLKCSSTRAATCTTGSPRNGRDNSRLRPRLAGRRIWHDKNCSGKTCSPSTSTASRAATPRCWPKPKPASSIARAATIIFSHPAVRARPARERRRQCLPRHRQPGHRPQNRKTKAGTGSVRRNARAGRKRQNHFAGGDFGNGHVNGARALGLAGQIR